MTNILNHIKEDRIARKQHDQMAGWAKDQFKTMKSARISLERQWFLNLAFYFGRQWVVPIKDINTGATTRLYTPIAPGWRQRPVINRIRKTIRTELSQLTNNKPTAFIVPASAEDKDVYAAAAGEQLWESEYLDKKLKFVIRRAVWWTLLTGTGYVKSYWDPVKKGGEGDICYIHETPFHVFVPDLRECEIENQPYIIHAQLKDPDFVNLYYKTDGGKITAEEILDDKHLNIHSTSARNKKVLVLECYIKPGRVKLFPDGAFFTVVEDKIVYGQVGLPFTHDYYPFAKIEHIPSGGYYSTSVIEDLIPLQKELNRTRGQIIENKNRMAKLQLVAPEGSVDVSKITSEPGLVVLYKPGFNPPTPLPLQNLPAFIYQELDRIAQDWNDISAQHEVTEGQTPPGVTAATAISYLQERDESALSPTFDSLEEGIEKIARMALCYIKEYWEIERTVKVTGVDGSFDVMVFKGSDLGDNTDIRVESGSSLPVSKAAKQALIMDLMKFGWIPPQQGLESMDIGGINKIYERLQVDKRQAQRENLRMMQVTEELQTIPGQSVVPVNTWDNHMIHIEEHNNCRKRQAFESAPEAVKIEFETHVNMHILALSGDPRATITQPPVGPEEENPENQNLAPEMGVDNAAYGG